MDHMTDLDNLKIDFSDILKSWSENIKDQKSNLPDKAEN